VRPSRPSHQPGRSRAEKFRRSRHRSSEAIGPWDLSHGKGLLDRAHRLPEPTIKLPFLRADLKLLLSESWKDIADGVQRESQLIRAPSRLAAWEKLMIVSTASRHSPNSPWVSTLTDAEALLCNSPSYPSQDPRARRRPLAGGLARSKTLRLPRPYVNSRILRSR
jgi:hypothetical protein